MESKTLVESLDYLWSCQLPFVFFRLPETNTVKCFYQLDKTLHHTTSLAIEGFVMAPFSTQEKIPFIPAKHQHSFVVSNASVTTKHPAVTLENSFKATFIDLVKKAKDTITKKGLQKVVVSRAIVHPLKTNPLTLFTNLLGLYPTAMVTFWHHPKVGTWLGASPEILVRMEGGWLQTMALAGTQVYSENTPPQWMDKEKEEQQFVTDQLKRDLEKHYPNKALSISKPYTKRAGNLLHLCTEFKLQGPHFVLKPLLDLIHPTPAVGGIPKEKALTFLRNNEAYDRSFYSGYLGPINTNSSQLFVNLRCAQWTENSLTLYVGAGITASSVPEMEWEETERKAETFLHAL